MGEQERHPAVLEQRLRHPAEQEFAQPGMAIGAGHDQPRSAAGGMRSDDVGDIARAGLGVVVVSSELPEVLALADRVLVMCEGRLTATFPRAEATPERVLAAALPDRAPASAL